jgi:hypothetical protein
VGLWAARHACVAELPLPAAAVSLYMMVKLLEEEVTLRMQHAMYVMRLLLWAPLPCTCYELTEAICPFFHRALDMLSLKQLIRCLNVSIKTGARSTSHGKVTSTWCIQQNTVAKCPPALWVPCLTCLHHSLHRHPVSTGSQEGGPTCLTVMWCPCMACIQQSSMYGAQREVPCFRPRQNGLLWPEQPCWPSLTG